MKSSALSTKFADPRPDASHRPAPAPHILIVDDEYFILSSLKLYFESNDFKVSCASSGLEALEVFEAERQRLDVVLLDLLMPGMPGLEVLRTIKEKEPSIQAIITTGCGSMGHAIEALRLGASDYVTKPILDFESDLLKSVRHAIDVRRSARRREDEDRAATNAVEESSRRWWIADELDQFAGQLLAGAPPELLLADAWRLLQQALSPEAGILLAQDAAGEWSPVYQWGEEVAPPGWRGTFLPVSPPEEGLEIFPSDGQHEDEVAGPWGRRWRWSLVHCPASCRWHGMLRLPLESRLPERHILILFLPRRGAQRTALVPADVPLALVTAVIGRALLLRFERSRKLAPVGQA